MKRVAVMMETVRALLGGPYENLLTTFPRDIERIVTFAVQVPIIKQRALTVSSVTKFLCAIRGNQNSSVETTDRSLNGLLYVGSPCPIIFINESLPLHLQTYIMAHELGHLLADVFLIQQLWLASLPEREDVIRKYFCWHKIDKDPWLELRAFLKGLPPRPRTILGRDNSLVPETLEREVLADLFAREIMAPWRKVEALYRTTSKRAFSESVRASFYLPLRVAANYYDDLDMSLSHKPDLFDRLHLKLSQ
jgi:hypothetical protein